jgi:hypothetical protein
MAGKIDSPGTYVGTISESGFGLTKNGFPQWVARILASKKWIETKEDLEHFKMAEPGYVDWSQFNEEIVAFSVLFKHATDLNATTVLLNYDQLKKATGWDGLQFDNFESFVGKDILFRVETNTYNDKTSLQVNWVDAADASPERQLKVLAPDETKKLSKLINMGGPKAAPAKPQAAKPPVAANPTPVASTTSSPATVAPVAATPITATTNAAPKTRTKTPPPAPPIEQPAVSTKDLPTELTRDQAWEALCTMAAGQDPKVIEDSWISATNELGDESKYSPKEWAKVRDICLKDLALAK